MDGSANLTLKPSSSPSLTNSANVPACRERRNTQTKQCKKTKPVGQGGGVNAVPLSVEGADSVVDSDDNDFGRWMMRRALRGYP